MYMYMYCISGNFKYYMYLNAVYRYFNFRSDYVNFGSISEKNLIIVNVLFTIIDLIILIIAAANLIDYTFVANTIISYQQIIEGSTRISLHWTLLAGETVHTNHGWFLLLQ